MLCKALHEAVVHAFCRLADGWRKLVIFMKVGDPGLGCDSRCLNAKAHALHYYVYENLLCS